MSIFGRNSWKKQFPTFCYSSVAGSKTIRLIVYNHSFTLDDHPNQQLFVDERLQSTPYYYPSINDWQVRSYQSAGFIYLETDFHLLIQHAWANTFLTMPVTSDTLGNQTLCGLAGNIDDNCLNDFLKR
jgi:hypothetical protein